MILNKMLLTSFAPPKPPHVIAVCSMRELWISNDYGASFSVRLNDAHMANYVDVAVSQYGQYLIVATEWKHCVTSNDYGQTWRTFSHTQDWVNKRVAIDHTGQYQYVCTADRIFASHDYGQTFSQVFYYPDGTITDISVYNYYGSPWTIFCTSDGYIHLATSTSYSFSPINYESGVEFHRISIGEQTILATARNYHTRVSNNLGSSWLEFSAPPAMDNAVSLSGYYAAQVGEINYLYFSSSYGQSWWNNGIDAYYRSCAISPSGKYWGIFYDESGQYGAFSINSNYNSGAWTKYGGTYYLDYIAEAMAISDDIP